MTPKSEYQANICSLRFGVSLYAANEKHLRLTDAMRKFSTSIFPADFLIKKVNNIVDAYVSVPNAIVLVRNAFVSVIII